MSYSKKGWIIVLLLMTTMTFYGQQRPGKDKIKSLKIAFITERLDLTSKEAQAFWPIYNEHESKMEALHQKERKQIRSKLRDIETISDKEAYNLLDQYMDMEEQKNKMNRAFFEQLSKVLSAQKTFLLIKTEKDFKRQLIKRLRERQHGGN